MGSLLGEHDTPLTISRRVAGVFLLLATMLPARADVLFSNLTADGSYNSNAGQFVTGSATIFGGDFDQGSRFIAPGNYTLDSVDAGLGWFEIGPNVIDLWLMSDQGSLPGVILESFRLQDLPYTAKTALVTAVSTLHPVLSAGTQYWLVASAGEPASVMTWGYNSIVPYEYHSLVYRVNEGPWQFSNPAVAFSIYGTPLATPLPEPDSFAIFGAVLAVLAITSRSRKDLARQLRTPPLIG